MTPFNVFFQSIYFILGQRGARGNCISCVNCWIFLGAKYSCALDVRLAWTFIHKILTTKWKKLGPFELHGRDRCWIRATIIYNFYKISEHAIIKQCSIHSQCEWFTSIWQKHWSKINFSWFKFSIGRIWRKKRSQEKASRRRRLSPQGGRGKERRERKEV